MSKASLLYCLLFWIVAPGAIADSSTQISQTSYLNQATAGVRQINARQLSRLLENTSNRAILLDVRTFHERSRTNTIEGDREIHIPRGFLEIKAWDTLPKNREIVVYCSKGIRSKLAAKTLMEMGWKKVSSLEGGIEAWYALKNEDCGCLPENQEIPTERPGPGVGPARVGVN